MITIQLGDTFRGGPLRRITALDFPNLGDPCATGSISISGIGANGQTQPTTIPSGSPYEYLELTGEASGTDGGEDSFWKYRSIDFTFPAAGFSAPYSSGDLIFGICFDTFSELVFPTPIAVPTFEAVYLTVPSIWMIERDIGTIKNLGDSTEWSASRAIRVAAGGSTIFVQHIVGYLAPSNDVGADTWITGGQEGLPQYDGILGGNTCTMHKCRQVYEIAAADSPSVQTGTDTEDLCAGGSIDFPNGSGALVIGGGPGRLFQDGSLFDANGALTIFDLMLANARGGVQLVCRDICEEGGDLGGTDYKFTEISDSSGWVAWGGNESGSPDPGDGYFLVNNEIASAWPDTYDDPLAWRAMSLLEDD